MKLLLFVFVSIFIISCNSKHEPEKEVKVEDFTYADVVEKDSLVYFKSKNELFTGLIVEKDSNDRVVKEFNYTMGIKHGQEIYYEYFYSDVAIVVLEGNWTNGKKSGIWKSHDGEGQMTVIKKYN